MDNKLRHNLHQCPGYLREEVTLASDVSKSVIISHAFPSQSEVCSICGQLVQYKFVHGEKRVGNSLSGSHNPPRLHSSGIPSPQSPIDGPTLPVLSDMSDSDSILIPPFPTLSNHLTHRPILQLLRNAQATRGPPQRSPRVSASHAQHFEGGWDRRPPPTDQRDWGERRPRHGGDSVSHPPQPYSFHPPQVPNPTPPSPRQHGTRYWDNRPTMSGPPSFQLGFRTYFPFQQQQQQPSHHEQQDRRYEPEYDARESRDYKAERHCSRSYPVSTEGTRRNPPLHAMASSNSRSSESHPGSALPDPKDRRRRPKEREQEIQPQHQSLQQSHAPQMSPQYPPIPSTLTQEPTSKKEMQERRKKVHFKETMEEGTSEGMRAFGAPGNFKSGCSKFSSFRSSSGWGSSRSVQPSRTNATSPPPSRVVDEDYDEGVVDASINLWSYCASDNSGLAGDTPSYSPIIWSVHSRRGNSFAIIHYLLSFQPR